MLSIAIVCKNKNCAEVFRVQYSNQEEKSEDLPLKPKRIEHQGFWCWICGTVFPYTYEDLRLEDVHKLVPGQHRVGKAAFRTVLQCGQENCGAPVAVNTITDDPQTTEDLRARVACMTGKAVCQSGHECLLTTAPVDPHSIKSQSIKSDFLFLRRCHCHVLGPHDFGSHSGGVRLTRDGGDVSNERGSANSNVGRGGAWGDQSGSGNVGGNVTGGSVPTCGTGGRVGGGSKGARGPGKYP